MSKNRFNTPLSLSVDENTLILKMAHSSGNISKSQLIRNLIYKEADHMRKLGLLK